MTSADFALPLFVIGLGQGGALCLQVVTALAMRHGGDPQWRWHASLAGAMTALCVTMGFVVAGAS